MIQEIKIKNFLSFRDEVRLNFEASSDKFADDCQVVTINDNSKTRLLRLGVVYGYNASGKSNLLKAFDFLHSFWTNNSSSADSGTNVVSFRLDNISSTKSSQFELTFFVEDTKYSYSLELDIDQVKLEELSYYKDSHPVMLFKRVLENEQSKIIFNDQQGDEVSPVVKEKITVECLRNISFFVARDKANISMPLIDAAKNWMRKQFKPSISPSADLTMPAEMLIYKDEALVNDLINFLQEADFNITNVSTSVITQSTADALVKALIDNSRLSVAQREEILKSKTIQRQKTLFEHTVKNGTENASYNFSLRQESLGTLKTFGIEAALYKAIQDKAFLPIDEVENSLHPRLLEKIIYEYLRKPSRSQLLLTTHNDGLLDLVGDLIRKDSIWFTEKDKTGTTDLYKLTDFKGVNSLKSYREAYRNKRFGATMNDGE
jgi:hypothetical protein